MLWSEETPKDDPESGDEDEDEDEVCVKLSSNCEVVLKGFKISYVTIWQTFISKCAKRHCAVYIGKCSTGAILTMCICYFILDSKLEQSANMKFCVKTAKSIKNKAAMSHLRCFESHTCFKSGRTSGIIIRKTSNELNPQKIMKSFGKFSIIIVREQFTT